MQIMGETTTTFCLAESCLIAMKVGLSEQSSQATKPVIYWLPLNVARNATATRGGGFLAGFCFSLHLRGELVKALSRLRTLVSRWYLIL
jgi:hypothetical protein